MLFGDVLAHIPQVVVVSTSLGTFPRPVPRPLPGVTLPASPECPTPLYWGWLWGGRSWSRSLTRGWSSAWTWVLALVNVRVVGFVPGHCRAIAAPLPRPLPGVPLPASPECLTPQTWGWLFDGRLVACSWSSLWSMVCSTRVFDVVGVAAGRSLGRPGGRRRC